jgi:hypothetical protein
LSSVTTETVLDFMRYCRQTPIVGRPANVVSMTGKRLDHYSSTTINHRLAAAADGQGVCDVPASSLRKIE